MENLDIVITTFNRAHQLRIAIESILAQNDQAFTLYVLDNCSTDDTQDVCAELLTPPHCYICNEANLGMVGNWNRALETGTSDHVHIMHDDDELCPDFVKHVRAASKPDYAFIHTGTLMIDSAGKVTGQRVFDIPEHMPGDAFFKGWLDGKVMAICPTVVFNRNRMSDSLRFSPDLPFTADLIFFLQMSGQGAVGYVPHPVFRYRNHEGSTTSSLAAQIERKVKDRQAAASLLQHEADTRNLNVPNAATIGRDYRDRALMADIVFTRLLGGGLGDVIHVAKAVSTAEPSLLRQPGFYKAVVTAVIPAAVLRNLGGVRRRLLAKQAGTVANV
jgi:glycosyltransferase involved in cell wall biosynthesis